MLILGDGIRMILALPVSVLLLVLVGGGVWLKMELKKV